MNAGMVIDTTGDINAKNNRNASVIQNGEHTTKQGTCWICGAQGTMDKYVWKHTVGKGEFSRGSEDTVVVCRACKQVPSSYSPDQYGTGSGC